MNLPRATLCGLMLCAAIELPAGGWTVPQERLQEQPRFRSGVDLVSVPVLVKKGREFVSDLAPGDFALYDDGVSQQVTIVSSATVPLDVTLVVDASSSIRSDMPGFKDSVKRLIGTLRRDDRLSVLAFSTHLEQIVPLQPPGSPVSLDYIQAAGATAVYDALVQVMMIGSAPDRRQFIALLSDGRDNRSAISPATLLEVARRYEGLIHVLPLERSFNNDAVREAARITGGEVHRSTSSEALARKFEEIFTEERQSYVLSFVPHCSKGSGWHEVSVRIARPGADRYTVRARHGYFGGSPRS